jgi:hypothetical protein
MLANTNTPYAPWAAVDATNREYRMYSICRALIDRLEQALDVSATEWPSLQELERDGAGNDKASKAAKKDKEKDKAAAAAENNGKNKKKKEKGKKKKEKGAEGNRSGEGYPANDDTGDDFAGDDLAADEATESGGMATGTGESTYA